MRGQKVAGDKVRLAGEVVRSKFMVLCDSSKGAHAASTSWLQRKGRAVSLRTVWKFVVAFLTEDSEQQEENRATGSRTILPWIFPSENLFRVFNT